MTRERVSIAPVAAEPAVWSAIVERARRRGFRRFVVDEHVEFAAEAGEEVVRRDGDRLRRPGADSRPVPIVRVADEAALAGVLREVAPGSAVAIEWSADRVIPLENAVASRGRRFELWAYARSPSEVPAALGAL